MYHTPCHKRIKEQRRKHKFKSTEICRIKWHKNIVRSFSILLCSEITFSSPNLRKRHLPRNHIIKHKLSPIACNVLISSNVHETFKHIRLSGGSGQRRASGFAWQAKPGWLGLFVRTFGRLSNVFLRRLVGIGSDKLAEPAKSLRRPFDVPPCPSPRGYQRRYIRFLDLFLPSNFSVASHARFLYYS